jgi:hypothetical protein
MKPAVRQFSISFESARVDREAGVIRGVAVITEGPALGHGMFVDDVTLAQVKAAAETYKNGLKVKMTHGGDAGDIVGALRDFRIDGKILRADLYPLKSYEKREYVFELAETIPDTFGLSISFSGPDEERDGKTFARCLEIYSCDLVAEPAANPSGLFSQADPKPNQPQKMSPEDIKSAIEAALSEKLEPMLARLSKLETAPAPVAPEEKEGELSAKTKAAVELAARESALATIKQFNLGAPPPAAPSNPAAPKVEKKFEEIVRELKAAGKSHNDAVREAMSANGAAHQDYTSRVQKGEVIMF